MSDEQVVNIDPLSGVSLMVKAMFDDKVLSSATAFTIAVDEQHYLVTNWHVVTGRDANTKKALSPKAAIPDRLLVVFHSQAQIGHWAAREVRLYGADGQPTWLEHPSGNNVDVVLIPLPLEPVIAYYPLDLAFARKDVLVQPAMTVSIIGYPLGLTAHGAWPIWKTGHIASEPDLDYNDMPCFLVDATTREGMSGSPVVLRFWGGYPKRDGSRIIGGSVTSFLGIYSGRIHKESEIGLVWRPRVIGEILAEVEA